MVYTTVAYIFKGAAHSLFSITTNISTEEYIGYPVQEVISDAR